MKDSSITAPRLISWGASVYSSGRPDCEVGAPQFDDWGAPIQMLGRRDI